LGLVELAVREKQRLATTVTLVHEVATVGLVRIISLELLVVQVEPTTPLQVLHYLVTIHQLFQCCLIQLAQ
jgi:hypothetical protein